MKGLKYQLKNIRRDKLCIISFLLPVIAGLAVSLISEMSFSSVGETAFYVLEKDLLTGQMEWLQENGSITVFSDITSLKKAVNDPATQGIGVLKEGTGIQTLLSGDELQINTVIGNTLPTLFGQRNNKILSQISMIPSAAQKNGLKYLLIAITMLTAMFMSCTFNAMNIIGEKEDHISFINEILPMTRMEYLMQKITLGFAGGILSTVFTACACMRIRADQIFPSLLLIILSVFAASLAGLFIGNFSKGMMTGIFCIKVVMLLFLAPPVLFYLAVPQGSLMYILSYCFPSSAVFYGLMELLSGGTEGVFINIIVLSLHCVTWMLLFLSGYRSRKIKKYLYN